MSSWPMARYSGSVSTAAGGFEWRGVGVGTMAWQKMSMALRAVATNMSTAPGPKVKDAASSPEKTGAEHRSSLAAEEAAQGLAGAVHSSQSHRGAASPRE